MPVEATPTNDSRVIISQSHGQRGTDKPKWQKFVIPAMFVGLSGFVLAFEMLDSMLGIERKLPIVTHIFAALVGLGAGFATSHSGLFDKRKRE